MGLNVYGVQQRLNFLGYLVEPTGVFNEETVSQLEKFEADYGLESSNKIDQDIIRLLNAVVGLSDETIEMKDMQLEKAVQVLLGQ
jgi:peptidoglycan hydrolase-like protein with peptidoglycan-binding domain